jgi:hypothetical protein
MTEIRAAFLGKVSVLLGLRAELTVEMNGAQVNLLGGRRVAPSSRQIAINRPAIAQQ